MNIFRASSGYILCNNLLVIFCLKGLCSFSSMLGHDHLARTPVSHILRKKLVMSSTLEESHTFWYQCCLNHTKTSGRAFASAGRVPAPPEWHWENDALLSAGELGSIFPLSSALTPVLNTIMITALCASSLQPGSHQEGWDQNLGNATCKKIPLLFARSHIRSDSYENLFLLSALVLTETPG